MLTVSNYHYIRTSFESKFPSIFGVTPDDFKKQLKKLNEIGDFISPNELLSNSVEILNSKENFFLITFDDGLKEQINLGLSILNEMELPALFFANSMNYEENKVSLVHKIHLIRSILDSNLIIKKIDEDYKISLNSLDKTKAYQTYIYDNNSDAEAKYLLNFKISNALLDQVISNYFNNYFHEEEVLNKLYMTKNDLISLSKEGFLGSHTHSHIPIAQLNDDELIFELEHSKNYLETATKTKINFISYPYGTKEACDERVATYAEKLGYKMGFSTIRGTNNGLQNNLLLNRFDCNDLPGSKKFEKII